MPISALRIREKKLLCPIGVAALPKWVVGDMPDLPSIATEERTSRDFSNVPNGLVHRSKQRTAHFVRNAAACLARCVQPCRPGLVVFGVCVDAQCAPTCFRAIGSNRFSDD